jgi:hypothetical protein
MFKIGQKVKFTPVAVAIVGDRYKDKVMTIANINAGHEGYIYVCPQYAMDTWISEVYLESCTKIKQRNLPEWW